MGESLRADDSMYPLLGAGLTASFPPRVGTHWSAAHLFQGRQARGHVWSATPQPRVEPRVDSRYFPRRPLLDDATPDREIRNADAFAHSSAPMDPRRRPGHLRHPQLGLALLRRQ